MSLVATLICNPASPSLDSTAIDAARAILPGVGPARWLFEGVAADIPFANPDDRSAVIKRLREALGDLPVDVVVQPEIGRRKRLFLADMRGGLTKALQQRDEPFGDYRTVESHD